MNWFKKYKTLLIVFTVVIGFYIFSAWSHYSWPERFKSEMGTDWKVFVEQNNAIDPIYPYTFFTPPVSRLGLIQSSSINKLGDGIYEYNLMWADGPIGNRMPAETFVSFADCNNGLDGNLREGIKKFSSLADIKWSHPDDNRYTTSAEDKQRLIKSFKLQCDILIQE